MKAREVETVSMRALNMREPIAGSEAHHGTRPKRASSTTRSSFDFERRTTGAGVVGAMLYKGVQAPAMRSSASKSAAMSGLDFVFAYLPHMPSR
ncbi:hypothetical protein GCM10009783_32000 [Glycomyces lechevalierae]